MKTVPLHGKKAAGRVALVDDEDYALVSQYRWWVSERSRTDHLTLTYATGRLFGSPSSGSPIYMHRLVASYDRVEHQDQNGLNNQRYNLREAPTQAENNANARRRSDNTSGFKGVSWSADRCAWRASVTVAGRHQHRGYFADPADAAGAYDAAALAIWGPFACVNFPRPA